MNKENLLKLADYLDKLPKKYSEKYFNMKEFATVDHQEIEPRQLRVKKT